MLDPPVTGGLTTVGMTDVLHASTVAVPVASRTGWRESKWLALPVLLVGTCLIVLDFFIVNVAMASMQRELHAGPTAVEWVVAGYGLTFAVFLLAAGRLGDRIGRARLVAAGIPGFPAASLLSGIAPSPPVPVPGAPLPGRR